MSKTKTVEPKVPLDVVLEQCKKELQYYPENSAHRIKILDQIDIYEKRLRGEK